MVRFITKCEFTGSEKFVSRLLIVCIPYSGLPPRVSKKRHWFSDFEFQEGSVTDAVIGEYFRASAVAMKANPVIVNLSHERRWRPGQKVFARRAGDPSQPVPYAEVAHISLLGFPPENDILRVKKVRMWKWYVGC